ncbi:hypothetical protein F444_16203 [Phytophthora nicotianae P1976]|uniref:1,3-beta-glucan synthase component FKS1-like domain-containing protein n=2 Tax=Phytophthora nicotianae TaxID=4792 RepID=A0A080ZJA3_PHYNI|nr:hypothetical protein F444_16203 [Phytophthora nicotianae P1976]
MEAEYRLHALPARVPPATFINSPLVGYVRPLYNVVTKIHPQKNGAGVDHKNVINYDDVNEFFSYRSNLDDTDGFKFYSNFFTSDIKDTRNHVFYSIFMTISGSQGSARRVD